MATKNIRRSLLERALALEIQAAKIRGFIRKADKEGFDWQAVDDIQLDSIKMILGVELDLQREAEENDG